MTCKCEKLKIKVNNDGVGNYTKGTIITVDSCDGIPKSKFWRDRIKDSAIDGCVSVIPKRMKKATDEKSNQETNQ